MPANGVGRAVGGGCKSANGLSQSGAGVGGSADGVCRLASGSCINAKTQRCKDAMILGSASVHLLGGVTEQVVSAPPGSRVFIWTRQVINGRKDALKRTHATVPPPEGPGS